MELIADQYVLLDRMLCTCDTVRALGTGNMTRAVIEDHLRSLKARWKTFEDLDLKIQMATTKGDRMGEYFDQDIFCTGENVYLEQSAQLLDWLDALESTRPLVIDHAPPPDHCPLDIQQCDAACIESTSAKASHLAITRARDLLCEDVDAKESLTGPLAPRSTLVDRSSTSNPSSTFAIAPPRTSPIDARRSCDPSRAVPIESSRLSSPEPPRSTPVDRPSTDALRSSRSESPLSNDLVPSHPIESQRPIPLVRSFSECILKSTDPCTVDLVDRRSTVDLRRSSYIDPSSSTAAAQPTASEPPHSDLVSRPQSIETCHPILEPECDRSPPIDPRPSILAGRTSTRELPRVTSVDRSTPTDAPRSIFSEPYRSFSVDQPSPTDARRSSCSEPLRSSCSEPPCSNPATQPHSNESRHPTPLKLHCAKSSPIDPSPAILDDRTTSTDHLRLTSVAQLYTSAARRSNPLEPPRSSFVFRSFLGACRSPTDARRSIPVEPPRSTVVTRRSTTDARRSTPFEPPRSLYVTRHSLNDDRHSISLEPPRSPHVARRSPIEVRRSIPAESPHSSLGARRPPTDARRSLPFEPPRSLLVAQLCTTAARRSTPSKTSSSPLVSRRSTIDACRLIPLEPPRSHPVISRSFHGARRSPSDARRSIPVEPPRSTLVIRRSTTDARRSIPFEPPRSLVVIGRSPNDARRSNSFEPLRSFLVSRPFTTDACRSTPFEPLRSPRGARHSTTDAHRSIPLEPPRSFLVARRFTTDTRRSILSEPPRSPLGSRRSTTNFRRSRSTPFEPLCSHPGTSRSPTDALRSIPLDPPRSFLVTRRSPADARRSTPFEPLCSLLGTRRSPIDARRSIPLEPSRSLIVARRSPTDVRRSIPSALPRSFIVARRPPTDARRLTLFEPLCSFFGTRRSPIDARRSIPLEPPNSNIVARRSLTDARRSIPLGSQCDWSTSITRHLSGPDDRLFSKSHLRSTSVARPLSTVALPRITESRQPIFLDHSRDRPVSIHCRVSRIVDRASSSVDLRTTSVARIAATDALRSILAASSQSILDNHRCSIKTLRSVSLYARCTRSVRSYHYRPSLSILGVQPRAMESLRSTSLEAHCARSVRTDLHRSRSVGRCTSLGHFRTFPIGLAATLDPFRVSRSAAPQPSHVDDACRSTHAARLSLTDLLKLSRFDRRSSIGSVQSIFVKLTLPRDVSDGLHRLTRFSNACPMLFGPITRPPRRSFLGYRGLSIALHRSTQVDRHPSRTALRRTLDSRTPPSRFNRSSPVQTVRLILVARLTAIDPSRSLLSERVSSVDPLASTNCDRPPSIGPRRTIPNRSLLSDRRSSFNSCGVAALLSRRSPSFDRRPSVTSFRASALSSRRSTFAERRPSFDLFRAAALSSRRSTPSTRRPSVDSFRPAAFSSHRSTRSGQPSPITPIDSHRSSYVHSMHSRQHIVDRVTSLDLRISISVDRTPSIDLPRSTSVDHSSSIADRGLTGRIITCIGTPWMTTCSSPWLFPVSGLGASKDSTGPRTARSDASHTAHGGRIGCPRRAATQKLPMRNLPSTRAVFARSLLPAGRIRT